MAETNAAESDTAGLRAAFDGPAPLANKIYLTLNPVMGRLSFVEFPSEGGGEPKFRAAVSMTVGDLVALRDLLSDMLKDAQQIQAQAKPDADKI